MKLAPSAADCSLSRKLQHDERDLKAKKIISLPKGIGGEIGNWYRFSCNIHKYDFFTKCNKLAIVSMF